MDEKAILKELADAVIACDPPRAKAAAETALKEGMDPVTAINEGLVVGMGVIGDNYAERKMYLPQVLVAAHKSAVTAVVQGDVHDIGKNIVKTMLTASGFIVCDAGKDVPGAEVVKDMLDNKAEVVCLSTLMTPTMDSMQDAVRMIKESGYRDKVIFTIGGPPTTQAFAEEIGADHRDENAQQCVKYVNSRL